MRMNPWVQVNQTSVKTAQKLEKEQSDVRNVDAQARGASKIVTKKRGTQESILAAVDTLALFGGPCPPIVFICEPRT